jgi:exodeoxyribonuclease VII small subunit
VAKSPRTATDPSALSFEDALAQIEAIIERIEAGEVGLEQSLAEYERGVGLINHCRSKLDRARQQVEDLTRKLRATDEGSAPAPASEEDREPGDAEPQF